MKGIVRNKRLPRPNRKDAPVMPAAEAEDRAILQAMGCSRDPDDCNMVWYRQQYQEKFGKDRP